MGQLDLKAAGFLRVTPGTTGRPPYDPQDLLKLYIYGYLNRIRSSRKLEQETHRNVEVMWLMRKLRPDHKTIADFRKHNGKAFKQVFREFTLLCRKLELFGNELIAVDGSRFKAVNNPSRNFTKKGLQERVDEIDRRIEAFLRDLDDADAQVTDKGHPGAKDLQNKIQQLKQRKQMYGSLTQQLKQTGENQVSLTDPDSRMSTKDPKAKVGYNAQIAVDDKHKLIVAQDVTNDINDTQQLCRMSLEAKEYLGVDGLKVVADSGYYDAQQIEACEAEGIEPYVPKRETSSCAARGLFSKDQFQYDPVADCYICPAGQKLTFRTAAPKSSEGPGSTHYRRHYATNACKGCPARSQCTTNKTGRVIYRWDHEEVLERMAKRVISNRQLMKRRKEIVEHPFGTMKFWNNQGHFLARGLGKVQAEFSLMALAHNIKRVLNLVGVPAMIEALALASEALVPAFLKRPERPHQGSFCGLKGLWITQTAQSCILARIRRWMPLAA